MPTAPASPGTGPDRQTCELRGWVVFGPGYHKGGLYTPADCARVAANFARLRGHLTPVMGLGHDRGKRLQASLGLPNVGEVTGVRAGPDGSLVLDVANVPAWLGGMVNAGRYRSGSIEVEPSAPDPDDPAKSLAGPVLTGLALLGEEQPAVKGYPPPKAVYPDGTEVPPNHEPLPVPAGMMATLSALHRDEVRLCFSELYAAPPPSREGPPVRDQLNQQLQAMGLDPASQPWAAMADDQLKAALDSMSGQQFSAAMKKKFADTPPGEPDEGDKTPVTMSALRKCMSDAVAPLTQRLGAVEKFAEDLQKKAPQIEQAAAFGADYKAIREADHRKRVADVVLRALTEGRMTKADEEAQVALGLSKSDAKTFSDGPAKGKTEFEAWRDALLARPVSPFFSERFDEPDASDPAADAFVAKAIKHLPGFREPAYRPASQMAK